ncbi:hypothetical protein CBR56_27700 [Bacillus thuringiensis]|uniref:DUF3310 domain-containing protein n=1 Tax=Bacillus thuringiensis TaxID=1428 RepID=UPI000C9EBC23|nr:DUF3310 domain-containing protein [Bacillus thuringiensis]PNK23070.1 hypothetical protein CBR56_27700 [Bacillus thuringiensis]PNK43044.1 hypothetical protein CBR58_26390 [Bacillus thuringiensis]
MVRCGHCNKDLTGCNYDMKSILCYTCYGKWRVESEEKQEKEDIINKPNHYHEGGIDPFKYGEANLTSAEMIGFYKMNVIKYLTRAGKKDDMIQDFKKAQKYMNKLVEFMGKK